MSEQEHMIGRLRVEVQAPRLPQVTQLQQELSYRLHTAGFRKALSDLLDTLSGPDDYIEIPHLTITLDCADDEGFQRQLLEKLSAAIKAKHDRPAIVSRGETLQGEAFTAAVRLFFLRYGAAAYYQSRAPLEALQAELRALPAQSQPALEAWIKREASAYPQVWRRLYCILGAEGMRRFFLRTFGLTEDTFVSALENDSLAVATVGAVAGLPKRKTARPAAKSGTIAQGQVPQDSIGWEKAGIRLLAAAQQGKSPLPEEHFVENDEIVPSRMPDEIGLVADKGMPVENAGVVLLWMACARLFYSQGLVEDRRFKDEAAQQQALWLLHYVAAGGTEAAEEALLLPKLLCAWPLHLPADPAFAPDETSRIAAEEMLTSWIAGWRKDRKFSTDWFRDAYLRREGRLLRRADGNWQLEVAAKTEDVLLDRVSVVKYAWMEQLLFVQW
ncbi:contractile injection system tape measure protein [Chitinophaga lutea]